VITSPPLEVASNGARELHFGLRIAGQGHLESAHSEHVDSELPVFGRFMLALPLRN
jgi:hypothetical protein